MLGSFVQGLRGFGAGAHAGAQAARAGMSGGVVRESMDQMGAAASLGVRGAGAARAGLATGYAGFRAARTAGRAFGATAPAIGRAAVAVAAAPTAAGYRAGGAAGRAFGRATGIGRNFSSEKSGGFSSTAERMGRRTGAAV